jgi:hypothetical protein
MMGRPASPQTTGPTLTSTSCSCLACAHASHEHSAPALGTCTRHRMFLQCNVTLMQMVTSAISSMYRFRVGHQSPRIHLPPRIQLERRIKPKKDTADVFTASGCWDMIWAMQQTLANRRPPNYCRTSGEPS